VVSVQALDRKVEMSIPPETPNGKTMRLRGLGMPNLRDPKKRGNLYVKVEIELPTNLTEEEHKLINKLRDLRES